MKNKNVLITGATAGIGLETAKVLAKKGANVYIVARNSDKAKMALEEIKSYSGNNNVDFFIADLSSQKEVRRLAAEVNAKLKTLEVLINNAGAAFQSFKYSEDNIELTFATNHLSYFLLTNLLLDLIKKSAPARIINVASDSHYRGKLDFGDLNMTKNFNGLRAYERSKLGNVLFTLELAERLQGSGVTVNALHPGRVKTDIGSKNSGLLYKMGWKFFKVFSSISIEKGAETSIFLADSAEVENVTGKYFAESKHKWHSKYSQMPGMKEKLWEASAKLTGLK
jgi:NAD(P)-dependent dehydrogenase (short-subunit alcohol dehydrogenase family)